MTEDAKNTTIKRLHEVVEEALTISLFAQLFARGKTRDQARQILDARNTPEYQALISSSGVSGYLSFQWISESLLKVASELSKVDLASFWVLVEAGRETTGVYEKPLKAAALPLTEPTSGVRTNLDKLFAKYPDNNIGL